MRYDPLELKDGSEIRGWQSIQFGRMGLKQLAGYYAAMPVEITDPVVPESTASTSTA